MFKKITSAAALAILASSAFADDKPLFYAGGDVGSTKLDGISGRNNSFGGFIGYQITDTLAVEAGYRRLADFDQTYSGTKVGVTVDQAAVSVVALLPLGSSGFNLSARVGYNKLDAKGSAGGFSAITSTSGALTGIGMGYAFTPTVSGRLELQKPSSDSTNVSAGVSFKF